MPQSVTFTLDFNEYTELFSEAQRHGVSVAGLVREYARHGLKTKPAMQFKRRGVPDAQKAPKEDRQRSFIYDRIRERPHDGRELMLLCSAAGFDMRKTHRLTAELVRANSVLVVGEVLRIGGEKWPVYRIDDTPPDSEQFSLVP